MNTTENNKLIVQFMGLNPTKVSENFYALAKNHVHVTGKNPEIVINGFSECAKYRTDWNWLMEVVDKIEQTTIIETYENFNENKVNAKISLSIENKFCQIFSNGLFLNEVTSIEGVTKIEAVYFACLGFIKWYNEQKTTLIS